MNNITTQLINFALDHHIGVTFAPLKPTTTPKSDSDTQLIIMNSNWPNKREISFQLGHEIGHLLNGDEGVYYYATTRSKQICEGDANRTALHIIIPMYFEDIDPDQANVHQFMTDLQIPMWLEHEATEIISDYYAS